jgi:capsid protein
MIKELNTGDDIEVVNPTGQSADATSFTKLQQRMIGAGQGISYEATSRDMSETSYSSARQGIIEDELTFDEEAEQLFAVMDNIYESFIEACFLAGLLKKAGYWTDKDAFYVHEWIKQPKAWIDPLKEASATKTALNYGIKTFKQVSAENGRNWKAQIDDIVEVNEYAKSKGLDLEGVIFNAKKEQPTSDGADDGTESPAEGNGDAEEQKHGDA